MKKILALVALIGLVFFVEAQTPKVNKDGGQLNSSKDSSVNAETIYLTLKPAFAFTSMSIQHTQKKGTGTVAGLAFVEASNNAVDWDVISDTLTITNVATNKKTWTFLNLAKPYNTFRVNVQTTGTSTSKPSAWWSGWGL